LSDPFNLARFVEAQDRVYGRVRDELRRGRKESHWIWYIFPQIDGLAHSVISHHYAIASRDEAKAYWAHPVLRARLLECTALVLAVQGRTIHEILSDPDDIKFRSSMTLFAHAAPEEGLFRKALEKYFGGAEDAATVEKLR
jgi:uncharacterized protein (DUF1810 family)